MPEKKPTRLIPVQIRNRCPVCGETSYSRGGVHPQCSVRQADEKHKSRIKQEKELAKAEEPAIPVNRVSPWQKSCPLCHAVQHVRKTVCGCGHTFAIKARPPTGEGEPT